MSLGQVTRTDFESVGEGLLIKQWNRGLDGSDKFNEVLLTEAVLDALTTQHVAHNLQKIWEQWSGNHG